MAYKEMLGTLPRALERAGIRPGDMVYIASDASLLLMAARKKCGVKTAVQREEFLHGFIDALQAYVGQAGTLLFPVFSWAFCRGEGFDICRTPGEVGALNNWILSERQDFRRTAHPLYSFMVWGGRSTELWRLANVDAWGEDSPFAYLHRHGGKMLLLNVSLQRGFTFMHYVEEAVRVPYRYMKNFRGQYIAETGARGERSYTMYVRDLAIHSRENVPDAMLEERGIVQMAKWESLTLKSFHLAEAFPIVADDLRHNGGRLCYIFDNYELKWGEGATHADDLGN